MDIIIEKMLAENISDVAEIEKICFAHPWSEKSLEEQLTNDISHFFVAKNIDGKSIGYAGMQAIVGEGYVTNIGVLPQYRGSGIGSRLVKQLIDTADGLRLDFISLEVRPSNTVAIALYKKYGFKEVGRRKNFYRSPTEDGLIMTYTRVEKG